MASPGVGGSLSAASDVLLNDPQDDQVLKRDQGYWKNLADAGGEINTASNTGTQGEGVFKQKTGSNFEFKRIRAGSNKVSVVGSTDSVDVDVNIANLGLTAAMVGLGNVNNTSDASKPISTATQTALNDKVDTTRAVNTTGSLTGGGDLSANRNLALVGDSATPGNSKYYGTNASGIKGYHDVPAVSFSNTMAFIMKSGASYPNRSTVTSDTSRVVVWIGDTAPAIGGNGAVDDVDFWWNTSA